MKDIKELDKQKGTHPGSDLVKQNHAYAIILLSAAAKSGDAGAITLAAQLAGAAPCVVCGYVHYACKCKEQ